MNLSSTLLPLSLGLSLSLSLSSTASPSFAPSPTVSTLSSTLGSTPAALTSWETVYDYIVDHATTYSETTIDELQDESDAGVKTWVVVGLGATRSPDLRSDVASVRSVDGTGLGWPQRGRLLVFPTRTEAQTCSDLIDAYRNSAALAPSWVPVGLAAPRVGRR